MAHPHRSARWCRQFLFFLLACGDSVTDPTGADPSTGMSSPSSGGAPTDPTSTEAATSASHATDDTIGTMGVTTEVSATTMAAPFCGDGEVQPELGEVCDPPTTDQDPAPYGECSSDCKSFPHCGDGVIQHPEEDCESPDVNCDECRNVGHFVFLTSIQYHGDLKGFARAETGLAGADEICTAHGKNLDGGSIGRG